MSSTQTATRGHWLGRMQFVLPPATKARFSASAAMLSVRRWVLRTISTAQGHDCCASCHLQDAGCAPAETTMTFLLMAYAMARLSAM